MTRRRTSAPGSADETGQEASYGSRYPIRQIKQFATSLEALGTPKKQRVIGELQQFEKDWLRNEPLDLLRSKYGDKPVANSEACRRANVRQIRPTNDTRVLLAIVDQAQTVYLLDVFHKSASTQGEVIARACDRARRLHERAKEP